MDWLAADLVTAGIIARPPHDAERPRERPPREEPSGEAPDGVDPDGQADGGGSGDGEL